jgi:hypothetical protein
MSTPALSPGPTIGAITQGPLFHQVREPERQIVRATVLPPHRSALVIASDR